MPYVPQSFIRRGIGRIMNLAAESCALKRGGLADLPVKAKELMKSRKGGQEIINSFADADLVFRIGNDELAAVPAWGVPKRTDQIVDSNGKTYSILHVDTRRHAGETLAHILYVGG